MQQVLIDEEKRRLYDTYGEDGLKGGFGSAPNGFGSAGMGFRFRTPEEIFRDFFGGDPFFAEEDIMFGIVLSISPFPFLLYLHP